MSHGTSPLVAFHRTGDRSRLAAELPAKVRPALFAPYRQLWSLRGDFPLLLPTGSEGSPWVESLADRIDDILSAQAAPGAAGEETRRQTLAVERNIRRRLHEGGSGSLSDFWAAACDRLLRENSADTPGPGLERIRSELDADALLLDCGAQAAPTILQRAWQEACRAQQADLQQRTRRLAQRLTDLLQADHARSADARRADALRKAVGGSDRTVLDFEAMARVLRTAPANPPFSAARRARIERAIEVLGSRPDTGSDDGSASWAFTFNDCESAQAALRQRLPAMRDLVCAIAIAELELDNRYDEARHDVLFSDFGVDRLGREDFALFPPSLITLHDPDAAERNRALALLESDKPFKIAVYLSDILDFDTDGIETESLGRKAQNLARFAVGLDEVFVLQATSASLYRLREALLQGMTGSIPALFSIYAATDYLAAAGAVESRAFPCFVYDPEAGEGQAARFSLAGNPQPERDWPAHDLVFEAPGHERAHEATAFTFVDFLAAYPGLSARFAPLAGNEGDGEENTAVPVAEYLDLDESERSRCFPFVALVDDRDRLYRAVVEESLITAAGRCRTAWRSLQELCGVSNSHVGAALEDAARVSTERAAAAARQAATPAASEPQPQSAPSAPPTPVAAPEEAEAADTVPSDDAWIETARCTSCNECRQINDRLFGYDADQRAFIADPDAGTYRELVEAAESCQVAIIHPGKPRNPDEPGLDELLKRAEPFV